jgi:hypothetical protein
MTACIILRNMIIEDEGPLAEDNDFIQKGSVPLADPTTEGVATDRHQFVTTRANLEDKRMSSKLLRDLIEHNWNTHGSRAV